MPLINRNFINIIVFIALLLTGVVFIYQNYIELREIVESIKIENILYSILITALAIIFNAYKFSAVLILSLKYRIKFFYWAIAYLKGFFLNMLIPYSGLVFRANYLKKTFKVSYLEYLGATYIFTIAGLFLMGALSSIYLTIISRNIFYLIPLIILSYILYVKFHLINRLKNIKFKITMIDKIFEKINIAGVILLKTKNNHNVGKFLVIFTVGAFIDFFAFVVVIYSYPIDLTMSSILIIYLSYSLSWIPRFTPANIGMQEIIISFASLLTGYGAINGLVLSITLRAISFMSGILAYISLITLNYISKDIN